MIVIPVNSFGGNITNIWVVQHGQCQDIFREVGEGAIKLD
jgi:hypothetical protein